jgi:vacuolar-type H+-ATPase subunit H
MTLSRVAGSELSPLDQIRQAEAEVNRRIAAARRVAEMTEVKARAQAADLKREAREAGRREGRAQYEQLVSRAEVEAEALLAQAHSQAEDLRRKGDMHMDSAVHRAVEVVVGLEGEADDA